MLRQALPVAARTPLRQAIIAVLELVLLLPPVRRSSGATRTIVRGIGTLETQAGVLQATAEREVDRREAIRRIAARARAVLATHGLR